MNYQSFLYHIRERFDPDSAAGKHCVPRILVHLTDTVARDEEAVKMQAVADFVTTEEGKEYKDCTDRLEVVVRPFCPCG